MIYRPLSVELMAAAVSVRSLEPFRRALLAHALVNDHVLDAIAAVNLGADAGTLRDLLLDEDWRAVARLGGLRAAAQLNPYTRTPKLLDLANAVDAVTVRELAEVGPLERLLRHVRPRRRPQQQKWERDLAHAPLSVSA